MSTCACGLPVIPGYRCLDEAPRTFPVDVVILDINLPGRDGFELAGALVNRPEAGIIMLTGRTRSEDRLAGLSLGADHYLTEPVDPAELRLLVRNLARRVATAGRASAASEPSAGATGATARDGAGTPTWRFALSRWCVIAPGGVSVTLSAAEHHLLSRLFEHPGHPIRRQLLVTEGRASSDETLGRGLDLIVFRLRRKVLAETGEALPIASARGIGYVFTGAMGTESA